MPCRRIGRISESVRVVIDEAAFAKNSSNVAAGSMMEIGDKNSDREDDLVDTFCYGIALALGNSDGF
jgi:hypothetical protein